jgi:hypothetical protein
MEVFRIRLWKTQGTPLLLHLEEFQISTRANGDPLPDFADAAGKSVARAGKESRGRGKLVEEEQEDEGEEEEEEEQGAGAEYIICKTAGRIEDEDMGRGIV